MALYKCRTCGDDNLLADEMRWIHRYTYDCKKCFSKIKKEYYDKNIKEFRKTEEGKRWSRNKTFKNKYGITIEDYELMIKNQNNCCLICKKEFSGNIRPDVDHHHGTKKVRGILCHICNLTLGYLREDENHIWNILEYLKRTTWSKGESDVQTIN